MNHLYREGLFESGDALVEEAGLPDDTAKAMKETFAQMHEHLSQVHPLQAQMLSICTGLAVPCGPMLG